MPSETNGPAPPDVSPDVPPEPPPSRAASNAVLRVLTALVGAPIALGLAYLGGWPFAVLLLACAVLAQQELYGLLERSDVHPYRIAGALLGGLVAIRALVPQAVPLAVMGGVLLMMAGPFRRHRGSMLNNLAATALGVFYPVVFLTYLLDLRQGSPLLTNFDAFSLTLSVFLLIWTTDTFAYITGRALGRRPLAPVISPKKTWEGAIGGAVSALILAAVLKGLVLDFMAWPHVIAFALICGVVSQLGDLAESQIKRSVGAKDSGTLLPGHGGMLDRFDAMTVAAPLVYLYLDHVAGLF